MNELGCTLEWFGASTFRLKIGKLVIFLDTWLDRPRNIPTFLRASEVTECDYILISHAHFDHLPGADIIAKNTGAKIIANGEAINVMRRAGVPEAQLVPIAGGETIEADPSVKIRPWPSLHCLPAWTGPHDHPLFMDSGHVYLGGYGTCTLDITRMMEKGFSGIRDAPDTAFQAEGKEYLAAMQEYLRDPANHYSWFDGGQIMYQILIEQPNQPVRSVLFSSHTGVYEGIMRALQPKPDIAILGVAGRPNLEGLPFQGSIAEFVVKEVEWLQMPERVIWCLHDQAPITPFYIDTKSVTEAVQARTKSRVVDLEHAKPYTVW